MSPRHPAPVLQALRGAVLSWALAAVSSTEVSGVDCYWRVWAQWACVWLGLRERLASLDYSTVGLARQRTFSVIHGLLDTIPVHNLAATAQLYML